MKVFERVKKVLENELWIEPKKLTEDATLMEDLGCDSLDAVEITMALEEEFDIEISDEDAERLTSIGKIVRYIEGRGK